MRFEHLAQVSDATGGECLDRTSGDGVDADVPAPELEGKIAYRRLQRCLGHAHDVIARYDLGGTVVGQSNDASSIRHERRGSAADSDQRVDAHIVRDAEALAA